MAPHTTSRLSAALPILQADLGDRYQLLRELGRGGMARVYLAHDLKHERMVALKVLRPELYEPQFVERFQREIRAVARLHHPHILPLHDSGEVAGLLFYVMPYVDGETLRERLMRAPALPWAEVVRITREVAEALDHAHGHGFVHRDVKPENVLLEDGHVRLADFGVAIATDPTAAPRLTAAGLLVGTPSYMAPEQTVGGGWVDGRADTYGLGCMVFEMLAGERLFSGDTPQEIMARRFRQPRPWLGRLSGRVPRAVHPTLERALAERPEDRYPAAGDFAAALAATLREGPGARLRARLGRFVSAFLGRLGSRLPMVALAPGLWAGMAAAQAPASPVTDALRSRAERAGRNLVAAAEAMPSDRYGFKPTPAQMGFGDIIAHVAVGSDALCASIGGVAAPRRRELAPKASKEQLVGRLREAFEFCGSALARVDDSTLAANVPYFGAGEVSRAEAVLAAAEEWAGHYSQLAVYLRLSGLVPPTARGS